MQQFVQLQIYRNIFYSDEEQNESTNDKNLSTVNNRQMENKSQLYVVPQVQQQMVKIQNNINNTSPTHALNENVSNKKSTTKCGCGKQYSSSASLYLHIRSIHNGIPPQNTSIQKKQIMQLSLSQVHYPSQNYQFKDYQPYAKLEHQSNQNQYPMDQGQYYPQSNYNSQSQTPNHQVKQEYSAHKWLLKSQNKGEMSDRIICEVCGHTYSCKSALKHHIKRKHPEVLEGLPPKPYIQGPKKKTKMAPVDCAICGETVHSRTALEVHIANKHRPQKYVRFAAKKTQNHQYHHEQQQQQRQQMPAFDEQLYEIYDKKCGCGSVYRSRSALNLHVKRKHGGVYPAGTTPKENIRRGKKTNAERLFGIQVQQHFRAQRSSSEESIYDSDNDYQPKIEERQANEQRFIQKDTRPALVPKMQQKLYQQQTPKVPFNPNEPRPILRKPQLYRPFKCGCGKTYTVSSALNLHIKKAHNWVIPLGTIGGPRGLMGGENEGEILKKNEQVHLGQSSIICSDCGQPSDNSYFKCKSCFNHLLCSTCFWATNNFSKEHDWICKDR